MKLGRDRRPWKVGDRRRSRSSPIEQKAPARSAKRAVQLTLPFSVSPTSIRSCRERINPRTEGASVAAHPTRSA